MEGRGVQRTPRKFDREAATEFLLGVFNPVTQCNKIHTVKCGTVPNGIYRRTI